MNIKQNDTPSWNLCPPFHSHVHSKCRKAALEHAERICRDKKIRLTALRRQILTLIWSEQKPIKAYELLRQLRTEHPHASPITIYRILDFLLAAGLIHRLQSLNAYIGCTHPYEVHSGQFLLCQRCEAVAELDSNHVVSSLEELSVHFDFEPHRHTVELTGLCSQCRQGG